MSKIYDEEIKRMQTLIGFGRNESKTKSAQPIVEYHAQAADGRTYGILRECDKFYIKVAPIKDTEILAEDYDYIGGYMNKKENEYTTYAVASKQFDMKLKAINEAYGSKKVIEQFSTVKPAEWQINETREMRDEINRFNQIVSNSELISEGKGGDVYVGKRSNSNDELKKTKPAQDTYTEKTTAKSKNNGDPFVEKPTTDKESGYDIASSVAENKKRRSVKLTEEQVLAWNRQQPDYMDKSQGTQVGSSSPYKEDVGCSSNQCEADTDPIKEGKAVHNTDDQNTPNPGTGEIGDGSPYSKRVNEGEEVDVEDVAGFDNDDDDDIEFEIEPEPEEDEDAPIEYNMDDDEVDVDDDVEFDEDMPFPEVGIGGKGMQGLENWENDWDKGIFDDDDDYNPWESRSRRKGERIYEVVLNDFGKHPAFGKEPFTYPSHDMADKFGKDWNDKSAKGRERYAKKIGNGDPYTEKVIDMITDSVVETLQRKKKV